LIGLSLILYVCFAEVSSIEWEAVKMSEEEEDLISRMYKLVGDRLETLSLSIHLVAFSFFWSFMFCRICLDFDLKVGRLFMHFLGFSIILLGLTYRAVNDCVQPDF